MPSLSIQEYGEVSQGSEKAKNEFMNYSQPRSKGESASER